MKNIALIFAGGTGQRMNSKSKPKQFLELHGRPIIIYTLQHFDNHKDIDEIYIVCLESWIQYLNDLLLKFNIKKVVNVVKGGGNGQESIFNGLKAMKDNIPSDSVVLIHDGVRPLISEALISENIRCVREKGSAISVAPAIETIFKKNITSTGIEEIIDRNLCEVAKAPQSFIFDDIYAAHKEAISKGVTNMIDSASLMIWHGAKLHTVKSDLINIKITTPLDFYIFRAILDSRENNQLHGLE